MAIDDYLSRVSCLEETFDEEAEHSRLILSQLHHDAGQPIVFNGRAYFMCITPRSGSTFLADILSKTGALGPCKEHFPAEYGNYVPDWMTAYRGIAEVFRVLRRDSLPTPFFGIKGSLLQMFPLISAGAFGNPSLPFRYLYLRRKDVIGQAISLCRAAKTGEWHSSDPHVPDPEISIGEIIASVKHLKRMEADWEVIFSMLRIKPLRLTYEQCVAEPKKTFTEIGSYLGVTWPFDPTTIRSSLTPLAEKRDPLWQTKLRSHFEDIEEAC